MTPNTEEAKSGESHLDVGAIGGGGVCFSNYQNISSKEGVHKSLPLSIAQGVVTSPKAVGVPGPNHNLA